MVKIILHGCNGKMGRMITEIVKSDVEAAIVAGIDTYTETMNEYPVFEDIKMCDVKADVVIDFSNAGAVDALLAWCVENRTPVVLCTTGLSEEQLKKVEEAAKETAVLKSANMSVGINLFLKILKEAAPTLAAAGFDIEIVEKHHNQKVDAPCVYGPSYTAIRLVYEPGGEYVKYWDDDAKAPWLFNGSSFITYDDPMSMALKAAYVRRTGLRGLMYWEHSYDLTGELFDALYEGLFVSP